MSDAVDLRQFRYFLALSETLNFGRAAERLHISQPPLSRQIRQLEEQLGVALFVRDKKTVALTDAGLAFLPEVRRTLAQAEVAIQAARSARCQKGGQFVVGYTTVFDRSVIPDVVGPLQARFPEWRILTRGKHSISLVRDLKSGVMDAAFIGLHTQTPGLVVQTLLEEPLVVALPSGHPLASKRRISFDMLRGESLFWFERRLNPGFYDYCQSFFERIHFKPVLLPEPPDHHMLLGQIAQGQGIALISKSLMKVRRAGVVFRALYPVAHEPTMGIAVAYLASNPSVVLPEFLRLARRSHSETTTDSAE